MKARELHIRHHPHPLATKMGLSIQTSRDPFGLDLALHQLAQSRIDLPFSF